MINILHFILVRELPKETLKKLIPKKSKEYQYKYIAETSKGSREGTVWATGMATATQKIGGWNLTDKIDFIRLTIEKTGKERN